MMSDLEKPLEIERLRSELATRKELAEVSLKAAISALAGLQALLNAVQVEQLLGEGYMPTQSLEQAEEHIKRGMAVLRAVIEGPSSDGR